MIPALAAPIAPARSVVPRESVAPLAAHDGAGAPAADPGWLSGLERRARELLQTGEPMVWDTLTREFEAQLIRSALEMTRGRRVEAAHKLGIGRNTITRKIQELGLELVSVNALDAGERGRRDTTPTTKEPPHEH